MSWFSWLKPKPKVRFATAQELVQFFGKDIIKISRWIGDNVWYWRDKVPADEWQTPCTTLTRLQGDCEDFAVLYSQIFTYLEWEHRIYCGYPKRGQGHAICVAESPKGFVYTSNDVFILTGCKNYEETVREAMPDMAIYRRTDSVGITVDSFA
jgi:hypothetical protein